MKGTLKRTIVSLTTAGVALSVAVAASTAQASPSDHVGDPELWGPALEALCDDPTLPAAQGYNLIDDPNDGSGGGILEGTDGPDLILGNGGNDHIYAGGGNDVVCGLFGFDELHGQGGNDALFGELHDDVLRGDGGRDYLDGGDQNDRCDGGNNADAADSSCETIAP
jgi:hypothetical protein